jgi:hypothetical protein
MWNVNKSTSIRQRVPKKNVPRRLFGGKMAEETGCYKK